MKAADIPEQYNCIDILERNLVDRADKVALYSPSRDMTFGQVAAEVNQVGNALRRLGVRFGDTVAILCLDRPEWVTSYFGTIKIGAIALSMNTLLKSPEHAFTLRDSHARVVIVHEALLPTIEPLCRNLNFVEHVIVVGDSSPDGWKSYRDWIEAESAELVAEPTHRDDFATLNYSSGTTGDPKGILHAHKDLPLTSQLWGVNVLGLCETDRTFAAAKLFFTYATGGNLIFPWYVGASVVLMEASPRDPTSVLATIERYQPTIHFNAPTGYAMMLSVDDFTSRYDLSSLRLCVSAGEALPVPIWNAWKEATGVDAIDGIGSTENYHIFLSNRPDDIRPGSSGKPFDGYELKIVDDNGNEVSRGEIGNLLVKGETASLSYLHQYERSRQTFVGEWLVTGDKYYEDEDGYFWHAGRADDMLKVGGIWVSPTEVESTLLRHAAVLECAVVGFEDGSKLIKPKAFVVLNRGCQPTEALAEELIQYCRQQIADYKRPRWIEFVEELPKTATGKIQRFKLRVV